MSSLDSLGLVHTTSTRALRGFATAAALSLFAACAPAAPSTELAERSSHAATAACAAEHASLDGAVASVATKTYDTLLEVISQDCGASFHTAGPSNLDEHRLVRIGSMTKTYVAVVTLKLVSEGKIALDHPVGEYLPEAPAAVSPMTVRQLLQHTSGLYSYTSLGAFWAKVAKDPHRHLAPSELVDFALTHDPYFPPGGGWQYSNTNYIVLGMMLEHVEGAPIARIVRDRVLTPNGLAETFFDSGEPVVGELAPGYFAPMPGLELPWTDGQDVSHAYNLSWAWAAGSMVASLPDATRFMGLVGRGALLPPDVQAELTNAVEMGVPNLRYGLGVMMLDPAITAGAGPAIGHGGDLMGYHTLGFYFPETGLTLGGAVDSDHGNPNDVLAAALGVLFPQRRAPALRVPRLGLTD